MRPIKIETALRAHYDELANNGKSARMAFDVYDALEESIPHALVVQLGELILKLKGAGQK